ncbi:MAG TPA: DUF4245 domain-containing protein [Humibacter sp.]|nr:DUF4245 domain-containing protein [Humibacter sp.]
MTAAKRPAVVAELGRPETPEETAARKAESSRNHRSRQTVNNLVYSLLATLALVAIVVLAVPRPSGSPTAAVDYAKIASQGQGSEPDPLVAPVLPSGWTSNNAQLRTDTADGVDSWYIGLITPKKQYIGITQGFKANSTWLAAQLADSSSDGTGTVGGVTWTIYDNRDTPRDVGDVKYALTTTAGDSTFVVFGTASNPEFDTVAHALAADINADEQKDGTK